MYLKTENTQQQQQLQQQWNLQLGEVPIKDVQTYKTIRGSMVDRVNIEKPLTKAEFDQLYIDLRRTQAFARQVSLPEKTKLQFKEAGGKNLEQAHKKLTDAGLIDKSDDDQFVKLMIWQQHLRCQPNHKAPSFTDVRQWIGMIYRTTLKNMAEETAIYKNSKPRTRSELFVRLYLLAKVSGIELEFHHTDFRQF
mmetsp:Transcript_244/g.468  ORF Transcript_244/g.468 Transcript_244/m.468 type:complete len:194 (+) Transcript_244:350-931(+)